MRTTIRHSPFRRSLFIRGSCSSFLEPLITRFCLRTRKLRVYPLNSSTTTDIPWRGLGNRGIPPRQGKRGREEEKERERKRKEHSARLLEPVVSYAKWKTSIGNGTKGWASADDRPNASLIPRTYLEINLNLGCPTRFLYGERKSFVRADVDQPVVVLSLFSFRAALE